MPDIKPGKKYFTVVYEVVDPDVFQSVAGFSSGQLANETVSKGAKITACGWGDCSTEADAYRQELQNDHQDTDEVLRDYIAEELGQVGVFPDDQALDDAVRNILG